MNRYHRHFVVRPAAFPLAGLLITLGALMLVGCGIGSVMGSDAGTDGGDGGGASPGDLLPPPGDGSSPNDLLAWTACNDVVVPVGNCPGCVGATGRPCKVCTMANGHPIAAPCLSTSGYYCVADCQQCWSCTQR